MSTIKKQFTVKAAPERAFRMFTAGIDRWWPREHHIGKSPMKELLIEPKKDGRWYAKCVDGSECDTGRVLVWEPPSRLVLTWQITSQWQFDANFVTEIEVRFTPEGSKHTRVDFEHRNLDRYGEATEGIIGQLNNPKGGWGSIMHTYATTTALKAVVTYSMAPDSMPKAMQHFPAHKARLDTFQARGELLAVGPWADPREGAMAVFLSREAAEEFVKEDPFITNGVVATSTIRDWNETILP
ncbi:MAG: SRPBCC domain-containing protein [Archangium sp.]